MSDVDNEQSDEYDDFDAEFVENKDNSTNAEEPALKKRKRKKKHKAQNNWVYVTGLPPDVTEEEIKDHFAKVGIIAINPIDQSRKIKIYRSEESLSAPCKGDASICYASNDSVTMALDYLNEGYIRPSFKITVTKAEFKIPAKDAENTKSAKPLTKAQIHIANNAMKQALSWSNEDDCGVSKTNALKIVVLQGMFSPSDIYVNGLITEDEIDPNSNGGVFLRELEGDIVDECTAKCGAIDKITVFTKNPKGVVIIKFSTAFAAEACIKLMDNRFYGGSKLRCFYWDGVTNYSVAASTALALATADNESEEKRLGEFGDWLEDQDDLPEDLKLRTEN